VCVLAAGCSRQAPAPPPPPPAPPLTEWPNGVTPPLKITDQLTLRIPLEYERAAIDPEHPAARAFMWQQSDRSEAQFDFFLPAFSGYTLENHRDDNDPQKVEVVYLHAGNHNEAEPGAAGEYPPNMRKRALETFLNPRDFKNQYGLRCYRTREASSRLTCYGKRDAAGEEIALTILEPPYPADSFPQMQARYFSTRYGGVRLEWRAHMSQLPHWREIDGQVWKFIEAWKVAGPPTGAAPTPPPARTSVPAQPAA